VALIVTFVGDGAQLEHGSILHRAQHRHEKHETPQREMTTAAIESSGRGMQQESPR